jgi:Novel STAND NTPase 2
MENQSPNPYFNLAMIRNVELFFGRTNLLRRFYTALANRQSVSILGRRRIGKSSFLWCASLPRMQAHFPFDLSHHIFIFLDLHDYLHKTSEDFFHRVSREIIEQGAQVPDLALSAEANGADAFSRVLDQVVKRGFFPVLLLDSFDKVTLNKNFGPEFFGFLRAQASRGRVSYVTASMKPLYEVCHQSIEGSPFFNIFYAYSLDALTPEEAYDLITIPSRDAGVTFTEEEVTLVNEFAGRHPFFIQRVCHFLFEEKTQSGNEEIDELHLESEVYHDLLPHFKGSWDQLTEEEKMRLRHEVREEENQQRKLSELSESALFRKFIYTTHQMGQFSISLEELESALDKINDPESLGTGILAYMQIVSRRLGRNAPPSTMEKGTVVREVLREAFELLRVGGTRNDSASEWRIYNILYYRYFKYHLKNEQINARLGLGSVRQFYRERTKAIEALRNVLLEMERAATR